MKLEVYDIWEAFASNSLWKQKQLITPEDTIIVFVNESLDVDAYIDIKKSTVNIFDVTGWRIACKASDKNYFSFRDDCPENIQAHLTELTKGFDENRNL